MKKQFFFFVNCTFASNYLNNLILLPKHLLRVYYKCQIILKSVILSERTKPFLITHYLGLWSKHEISFYKL